MTVALSYNINKDITADQLKIHIANKHQSAVCVDECKTGQSWGGNYKRLDMWVLLKTWSPWTIIGYEVKVNRQDFLNDNKWSEYLDYCHSLYFVCPPGIIHQDELPKEVGLMVGSKNLKKLVTRRKAIRHEPDAGKLNRLLSYILMSRVPKIVDNMYQIADYQEDRCAVVKNYLQQAEQRKELALMVKGHVRDVYTESRKSIREAERLMQQVELFKQMLKNLGIEWDYESNNWGENARVTSMINDLRQGLTAMEVEGLKRLGESMTKTANNLKDKYY